MANLSAFTLTSAEAQYAAPATGTFKPETGIASWYGDKFHGRKTANGEIYDMLAMTAAHKMLPFDTLVLVTNLDTGLKVVVRINDRGPFVDDRIIDISKAAAAYVGLTLTGIAPVHIQPAPAGSVLGPFPASSGSRPDSSIGSGSGISRPPVKAIRGVRIQVGSYKDIEHARNSVASLAVHGFEAVIEKAGIYHRVVVYVTPSEKGRVVSNLERAGWKDLLISERSR